MEAYYPMLKNALGMLLFLGIELSALFILISAGVSLLQQYIPDSKIQAVLSGGKGRGYFLAALLGSVTPFCSCSTIPMLRGLLKAKVGFGPTLTFLFTSPLLNPIIIGLFLVTFGFQVTVSYMAIALGISLLAGLFLDRMGFEKYVIPESQNKPVSGGSCCSAAPVIQPAVSCCASGPDMPSSCCGPKVSIPLMAKSPAIPKTPACCDNSSSAGVGNNSCCEATAKEAGVNFRQKLKIAFQDGWRQFKDVLPYLLIGVSLGAFVYGFVPDDFIAAHASGNNPLAVPIAAVIGIPLYVRAEALIPLSAVLATKGMGLGAIMALIIGGSGASLTELILLKSMFRTQMVAAFLVVILGMAIFACYFFQMFF